MRLCFIKKLHLWPRYHMSVKAALDGVEVIECEQELTESMGAVQRDVVDIMDACLVEVRKANKMDFSELTLEGALHQHFDQIVRKQLNPVWHKVAFPSSPVSRRQPPSSYDSLSFLPRPPAL